MVASMDLNQKNKIHNILDHVNADAIFVWIFVVLLLSSDFVDRHEINVVMIKYDNSNVAIMYTITPTISSALLTMISWTEVGA